MKTSSFTVFFIWCTLFWITLNQALASPIIRVNKGTSAIINEHSVCRKITNNSTSDIMIATKTLNEWQSFVNSNLPGVLKENCHICPGGSPATMGEACPDGGIYAGIFKGNRYMILPSGCDGTTTPSCSGDDTSVIARAWRGSTGSYAYISGAERLGLSSTPSTVLGDINTTAIVNDASTSSDSAADYCNDMVFAGHDDWYLPSKSELNYIFCNSNQSTVANDTYPEEQTNCGGDYGRSTALTGFKAENYHSSTQSTYSGGESFYFAQNFATGRQWNGANKGSSYLTRCIRRY